MSLGAGYHRGELPVPARWMVPVPEELDNVAFRQVLEQPLDMERLTVAQAKVSARLKGFFETLSTTIVQDVAFVILEFPELRSTDWPILSLPPFNNPAFLRCVDSSVASYYLEYKRQEASPVSGATRGVENEVSFYPCASLLLPLLCLTATNFELAFNLLTLFMGTRRALPPSRPTPAACRPCAMLFAP